MKINNEYGFIKKKYHINKNNFNKDIFKLINDDSNCLFFSKNAKTPEIGEADAFSNNDSEKNCKLILKINFCWNLKYFYFLVFLYINNDTIVTIFFVIWIVFN